MLLNLTAPFDYEFFRHGLLAATMVGALCGLVGTFVVLRRMRYIGHGMAHAGSGGAAVGYVPGRNLLLAAGPRGAARERGWRPQAGAELLGEPRHAKRG